MTYTKLEKTRIQIAIKQKHYERASRNFYRKLSFAKNKTKAFWDFVKGNKKSTIYPSHIIDPTAKSNLLDSRAEINQALETHFGNIGKDSTLTESKKRFVEKELGKIEIEMNDSLNMTTVKITKDQISTQIRKLKSGKSCGIDNILNEFLKNGGECILTTLTDLFIYFTDSESLPDEWREGLIKPIHKSRPLNNLDNYKGITLTSNVYKKYASIIENNVMDHLEANKVVGENQGVFRKGRRLEDNLFTIQGLCSARKGSNKHTYLAFS